MGQQTVTIQGTPSEAGAQLFEKTMLPALRAVLGRPEKEVAQFYAGMMAAALGSMAADFGHSRALEIANVTVQQFAGMAEAFGEKH